MARPSSREGMPLVLKPLTGGLDTKSPPSAVAPSSSPDALNVILSNEAVEPRGGMTPLIREQPKMGALRARAHRPRTRVHTGTPAAGQYNNDVLIATGMGVAGHRAIYNTHKDALTIAFFCSPENLKTQHVGNGDPPVGGNPPGGPAPFTINLRPILSKGPLKKAADVAASADAGTWDATAANVYGQGVTQTTDGMPFCIYLWNNAGTWEWRLSAHVRDSGTGVWSLLTATVSAVPVIEGAVYRVVASLDSGSEIRLRVARIVPGETSTYSMTTTAMAATQALPTSQCAIQVFDCPQQFVEATATGSTTQRPGLALGTATNPGGYFFHSKRFEGWIEDLAIYSGDKLETATALDRETRLEDIDRSDETLISHWSMDETGTDYAQETAGSGNPIVFLPRGPVTIPGRQPRLAEKVPGSWAFNGLTSYALANLIGNPNWNDVTTGGAGAEAALITLLKENRPHGLEVTFWVDSIEPQFESVIMEMHGVMRLVLDRDAKLAVYVRAAAGNGYQAKVASTIQLVPGRRYQVVVLRAGTGGNAGRQFVLYVNGEQEANSVSFAASLGAGDTHPLGGITWGMGSYEFIYDQRLAGPTEPSLNQVNTDHRSGFCGVIESARVVVGEVMADRNVGTRSDLVPVYDDEDRDDWTLDQARLFLNPNAGNRDQVRPSDPSDTVLSIGGYDGTGMCAEITRHVEGSRAEGVRYDIEAHNNSYYDLKLNSKAVADGGHETYLHHYVRIWHVLARWVFEVDDRRERYLGAYVDGVEVRYNSVSTNLEGSARFVHEQWSLDDTDQTGATLGVVRRCIESDPLTEVFANMATRLWTHRLRPYEFRSPCELGMQWAEGVVPAALGRNEITLLQDWPHEVSGERFLIAACSRQLYWLKPIWRDGSPFAGEVARAVWFGGQDGDHVRFLSSSTANQNLTYSGGHNTITWEAWVYPHRLDGNRLLAFKGATFWAQVNFAIWAEDGAINVAGTTGGNTAAWRFQSSQGANIPETLLRAGEWNHVHVTMGTQSTDTVTVHVNGHRVELQSVWDTFLASSDNAAAEPLFLGGLPLGRRTVTFGVVAGDEVLTFQAWHGLMTECRQTNAYDSARFPETTDGVVPRARYTADANTYYLLHMNEGSGWGFVNSATTVTNDGGYSGIRELVLLREGLDESRGHPYRARVFRDRLYLTNGLSDPQEVRFTRFSDPKGPFRCTRAGMAAPYLRNTASESVVSLTVLSTTGAQLQNGTFFIWMSFIDELGRESDPSLVGSPAALAASPANPRGWRINNCPRSHEDHVVGRRFYLSPNGGGVPIFHHDLDENESRDHDVYDPPPTGGAAVEAAVRSPMPRGRFITESSFQLVVSNLSDFDAGPSSFAWSRASEPTYFVLAGAAAQLAAIDSGDGSPIVGVFGHLGRLFQSKRQSVFQSDLADVLTAGARLVNGSIGLAAPVLWDNVVWGIGNRGVNRFDGAGGGYASPDLKGLWTGLDLSNEAMVAMHGVFFETEEQLWLSVRRAGQTHNDTMLVLQTSPIGPPGQQGWTEQRVPAHVALATAIVADQPTLILGTTNGQVLRANSAVLCDGADGGRQDDGTTVLSGTAQSITTTSLTIAAVSPNGSLDIVMAGLRGCVVEIVDSGTTYTRTITRSTRTTLEWSEPIVVGGGATTFKVGPINAYWTTGWLAPQRFGSFVRPGEIDFEVDPFPVSLDVRMLAAIATRTTARVFSDAAAGAAVALDMTNGWIENPVRVLNETRGRFFRVKFGTNGVNQFFRVSGLALRWDESGQRGGVSV